MSNLEITNDGRLIIKKRRHSELVVWGETERGNTIFRERNGVGGHRYWSDEIGGGVIVWDTALVNPETLMTVLVMEGKLRANAREEVAQLYRAEVYRSVDDESRDTEVDVRVDLSEFLNQLSTETLHKELCARQAEQGSAAESPMEYELDDYQRLLDHISESGAVDGEVFGMSRFNPDGTTNENIEHLAGVICDALKHAIGERVSEVQVHHMSMLAEQNLSDINEVRKTLDSQLTYIKANTNGISNERLYDLTGELLTYVDELEDIENAWECLIDPLPPGTSRALRRYEREALERRIGECEGGRETMERELASSKRKVEKLQSQLQDWCPAHIASETNPKVCGRCGIHIDDLRPDNGEVNG